MNTKEKYSICIKVGKIYRFVFIIKAFELWFGHCQTHPIDSIWIAQTFIGSFLNKLKPKLKYQRFPNNNFKSTAFFIFNKNLANLFVSRPLLPKGFLKKLIFVLKAGFKNKNVKLVDEDIWLNRFEMDKVFKYNQTS